MINHSEIRKLYNLSFFQKFRFRSKVLCSFWLIFYPLDPDPWICIFLRIWILIQEAKILRIQRIRILSTEPLAEKSKISIWTLELLIHCVSACNSRGFLYIDSPVFYFSLEDFLRILYGVEEGNRVDHQLIELFHLIGIDIAQFISEIQPSYISQVKILNNFER